MLEALTAILRHVLTALGTTLVTKGYLDAETLAGATGAVMTLVGVAWSVFNARKAKVKLERAIAAPAGKAE